MTTKPRGRRPKRGPAEERALAVRADEMVRESGVVEKIAARIKPCLDAAREAAVDLDVILEAPRVLRALLGRRGTVDMLEGDRLVLTNDHGKLSIVLESGQQRVPVVTVEPHMLAWYAFQVAPVWGHEALVVKAEDR